MIFRYEAAVLVTLYTFYITVMYFNRPLEAKIVKFVEGHLQRFRKPDEDTDTLEKGIVESDEKQPLSGRKIFSE